MEKFKKTAKKVIAVTAAISVDLFVGAMFAVAGAAITHVVFHGIA